MDWHGAVKTVAYELQKCDRVLRRLAYVIKELADLRAGRVRFEINRKLAVEPALSCVPQLCGHVAYVHDAIFHRYEVRRLVEERVALLEGLHSHKVKDFLNEPLAGAFLLYEQAMAADKALALVFPYPLLLVKHPDLAVVLHCGYVVLLKDQCSYEDWCALFCVIVFHKPLLLADIYKDFATTG